MFVAGKIRDRASGTPNRAAVATGAASAEPPPARQAHRIHAALPPFRETTPFRLKIYLDTPAEIDSAQLIQNKGKRSFYLDTEIDDNSFLLDRYP